MEFSGKYRVKKIMVGDEDGIRFFSREDIEAMEENEDTEDFIRMLKMIIEIGEDDLICKFKVTPEETAMAKEENPDALFDEEGNLVLESHKVVCQDGVWKFEMGEMDGEPCFYPFTRNDDGDLMYGEAIVLESI